MNHMTDPQPISSQGIDMNQIPSSYGPNQNPSNIGNCQSPLSYLPIRRYCDVPLPGQLNSGTLPRTIQSEEVNVDDSEMNFTSDDKSDGQSSQPSLQRYASILIVDDNAMNLIALQSQLKSMTAIQSQVQMIDQAHNGEEAVKMYKDRMDLCIESNWLFKPYRVIIMDYNMPFMDGSEAVKKIRQICEQIKGNDQT